MAERLPAPWVDATLSGRQQVALGLDGTGADQHCQCAAPVTAVNADGAVISSAPASRSAV